MEPVTPEMLIEQVIDLINEFDAECEENEYTDIEEVWSLFHRIRDDLSDALMLMTIVEN